MKSRSIEWKDLPDNAFIKWLRMGAEMSKEEEREFDTLQMSELEIELRTSLELIERELNENQYKGIKEVYLRCISLENDKTYLGGLFLHVLSGLNDEDSSKVTKLIKSYKPNLITDD